MSGIFGSNSAPAAAAAPTPAPPPTMPDPQSPDAIAAKRKAHQDIMSRAGRSSTILSSAMNRGGDGATPAYGSTKLGAGA